MSNPFADASVKAAASSTSYNAVPSIPKSNSTPSNSASSASGNRSSGSAVGGGASGNSRSLYDEAVREVQQNPIVQQATQTVMAAAVAANFTNLFSDKPPGVSSNAPSGKPASSFQPQKRVGGNSSVPTSDNQKDSNYIDCDPGELEEMKKWAAKLRMINLISCTLLILSSFFSLASNNLTTLFIAFYVLFFGVLLCCYELGLSIIAKAIAENFGFMYNFWPRKIFIILIAILCYELGLIGKIAMALLLGAEIAGTYVWYKHPQFEKYTRLKHLHGASEPMSSSTSVAEQV